MVMTSAVMVPKLNRDLLVATVVGWATPCRIQYEPTTTSLLLLYRDGPLRLVGVPVLLIHYYFIIETRDPTHV
jgi:hypothetical protein